jgi:hypothetical protein
LLIFAVPVPDEPAATWPAAIVRNEKLCQSNDVHISLIPLDTLIANLHRRDIGHLTFAALGGSGEEINRARRPSGDHIGIRVVVMGGRDVGPRDVKEGQVVATNSGWPPQSFLDDSNELVGFDIDVSKELSMRLGVEASFETPDWATMTGGHWQERRGRLITIGRCALPSFSREQIAVVRPV